MTHDFKTALESAMKVEKIGNQTLILADCLEVLGGLGKVDTVITSPPYAKQRNYAGIHETDYPAWALDWVKKCLFVSPHVFMNIKEHCKGGVRDSYVLRTLLTLVDNGIPWVDEFIWVKTNPFPTGSKTRLKDGFERIYQFGIGQIYPEQLLKPSTSKYKDDAKRRKNKGEHKTTNGSGMNMSRRVEVEAVRPSNVITFPTENTNQKHPATFPVALPEFFIQLSTRPGEKVLDPFMGSGTTLVACQQMGRHAIGIEIDPQYFQIACERVHNAWMQPDMFIETKPTHPTNTGD